MIIGKWYNNHNNDNNDNKDNNNDKITTTLTPGYGWPDMEISFISAWNYTIIDNIIIFCLYHYHYKYWYYHYHYHDHYEGEREKDIFVYIDRMIDR